MPQNLQQFYLDPKTLFPFELDQFQYDAINSLNAGRSVVVCAPTGSGKTLIGEYAIHRALARGQRVFYTTPLKALSNQKLRDFRDQFGSDRVGLLTGDVSVNRDAPILVMTTEIFRNMLYGTRIGEVGTSLQSVEVVVLDECHYMNDRQRGTVWEESIIYCPVDIQLVALSATVANSEQLTDWIAQVHGPTDLIYSDFRPVPLDFLFCNTKGLFPLLNRDGNKMNPRLKPRGGKRVRGRQESPLVTEVVSHLRERDMLPAIFFIFSRRGCDRAVAECETLNLVNAGEAQELKQRIAEFVVRNPEVARLGQTEPLHRGIAAHHAGILPAWKGFVEELFQEGLIKVVFATETLAAGINMPARTTVISSLSKRTDDGHRLLKPSEFLQMSGRAGRRGMDELGYVVTVQTPFEGAKEAAYLSTAGADPLVSQFAPSYGMVLNLLQKHSLEEAKELVERSFGQYLANVSLRPQQEALSELQAELTSLKAHFASLDIKQLERYEKLHERLKVERQLLKTLQEQAMQVSASEIAVALPYTMPGTILQLKGKYIRQTEPLPAALVTRIPSPGQAPYLLCLGQDNRWYVATNSDVIGLHPELPRIKAVEQMEPPPSDMKLKPGVSRQGTENTASISRLIPALTALEEAPEVVEQMQRVVAVQEAMNTHPIHQWGTPATLLKRYQRLSSLEAEIERYEIQLDRQSQRHWEEFLDLIAILQHFGGLEDLTPTALGEAAAAIRGDNELWLGLALTSGELDELDPHHFAAACAALVTEISRPGSWTHYNLSTEVEEALGHLRNLRRGLIQSQRRYRVAMPVWLEMDLVALVERWAMEEEWSALCEQTSLDEGDVVRMLRRTLDFLSQVPHVPHIPETLKQNAYRAIRLLDRFPVNEVLD